MLLAIDTATAACSAALIEDGVVRHAVHELVGRGHAERLVPMVEALLGEAGGVTPAAIAVDCGPGSFTGLRVGLAAAIGLGLGWGVPVCGYSSLAAIAAQSFADDPSLASAAVAISGGHGELFAQRFTARPFAAISELVSLPPPAAAEHAIEDIVIGSGAAALVAARGHGTAIEMLPHAAAVALLAPAFRSLEPRPIYGRGPDARPIAA
jgi:tRNA threonylcarbamoyladenosine biosynthesis protein TsaB